MSTQDFDALAKLSPLQENAQSDLNRQYSPGFDLCDADKIADRDLALKTFGQIDPKLTEKPPC